MASAGTAWALTQSDLIRRTFARVAKDGFVSADTAAGVLLSSGLSLDQLAQIWDLADKDRDGRLSDPEFVLAFHLCICVAMRRLPLPETLPEVLESWFREQMSRKAPKYSKGDRVVHQRSSDGLQRTGVVVGIHDDDIVRGYYYTVRLATPDAQELQTDEARIMLESAAKDVGLEFSAKREAPESGHFNGFEPVSKSISANDISFGAFMDATQPKIMPPTIPDDDEDLFGDFAGSSQVRTNENTVAIKKGDDHSREDMQDVRFDFPGQNPLPSNIENAPIPAINSSWNREKADGFPAFGEFTVSSNTVTSDVPLQMFVPSTFQPDVSLRTDDAIAKEVEEDDSFGDFTDGKEHAPHTDPSRESSVTAKLQPLDDLFSFAESSGFAQFVTPSASPPVDPQAFPINHSELQLGKLTESRLSPLVVPPVTSVASANEASPGVEGPSEHHVIDSAQDKFEGVYSWANEPALPEVSESRQIEENESTNISVVQMPNIGEPVFSKDDDETQNQDVTSGIDAEETVEIDEFAQPVSSQEGHEVTFGSVESPKPEWVEESRQSDLVDSIADKPDQGNDMFAVGNEHLVEHAKQLGEDDLESPTNRFETAPVHDQEAEPEVHRSDDSNHQDTLHSDTPIVPISSPTAFDDDRTTTISLSNTEAAPINASQHEEQADADAAERPDASNPAAFESAGSPSVVQTQQELIDKQRAEGANEAEEVDLEKDSFGDFDDEPVTATEVHLPSAVQRMESLSSFASAATEAKRATEPGKIEFNMDELMPDLASASSPPMTTDKIPFEFGELAAASQLSSPPGSEVTGDIITLDNIAAAGVQAGEDQSIEQEAPSTDSSLVDASDKQLEQQVEAISDDFPLTFSPPIQLAHEESSDKTEEEEGNNEAPETSSFPFETHAPGRNGIQLETMTSLEAPETGSEYNNEQPRIDDDDESGYPAVASTTSFSGEQSKLHGESSNNVLDSDPFATVDDHAEPGVVVETKPVSDARFDNFDDDEFGDFTS